MGCPTTLWLIQKSHGNIHMTKNRDADNKSVSDLVVQSSTPTMLMNDMFIEKTMDESF